MSTRHPQLSATVPSKGVYANYFEVGHSAFEIVMDFGQRYEGQPAAPCHTRIVMSPLYAHALRQMLEAALAEYGERFGGPSSHDVA
jgi:uncharacterized protein DUF3467